MVFRKVPRAQQFREAYHKRRHLCYLLFVTTSKQREEGRERERETCRYAYMYIYIHTCIYICICTRTYILCICIYIYIHTYTHGIAHRALITFERGPGGSRHGRGSWNAARGASSPPGRVVHEGLNRAGGGVGALIQSTPKSWNMENTVGFGVGGRSYSKFVLCENRMPTCGVSSIVVFCLPRPSLPPLGLRGLPTGILLLCKAGVL